MRALRRALGLAGLSVLTVTGFLALSQLEASAANTWFVGGPAAVNDASCGGSGTQAHPNTNHPCATLQFLLNKASTMDADTINIRAGNISGAASVINVTKGVIIQHDPASVGATNFLGGFVNAFFTINAPGKTVDLKNLVLFQGLTTAAGSGGGAVNIVAGTVNATDMNFTQNFASFAGGAVYVAPNTTFNATGGLFSGNIAGFNTVAGSGGNGGAVFVAGANGPTVGGKANLTNVTFTSNLADGQAILNAGNGGAIYNAGTTVVNGSTFNTQNRVTAGTNSSNVRTALGGVIFNGPFDADDVPSLTLGPAVTPALNTTFTTTMGVNNSAAQGGAIYNAGNLTGASGAVPGILSATNVSITGFRANQGGAIKVGGGTATLTGSTLATNTAVGNGGASYVSAGGVLNIAGGSVTGNTGVDGGAAYVEGSVVAAGAEGSLKVSGTTTFGGNRATGTATAHTGNGGAIYNSGSTTVDGATFTNNAAIQGTNNAVNPQRRGYGGSVFNGPTDTFDAPDALIDNSTFSGTVGTPNLLSKHATVGGAIANTNAIVSPAPSGSTPGVLTTHSTNISGATSFLGGALFNTGTATLNDGTISGSSSAPLINLAGLGNGGGVYNAGIATLDGTTVSTNTATADGGAGTGQGGGIWSSGSLTLDGATVKDNTATASTGTDGGLGGGVYATGTLLDITDSTIDNNTATGSATTGSGGGGGIYTSTAATNISGTTIKNNDATTPSAASTTGVTGFGGGLYGATVLTMDGDSHVTGNTAAGSAGALTGLGAGVFQAFGSAAISDTDFQGNTVSGTSSSSAIGGGYYNFGGSTSFDSASFGDVTPNTATIGGALAASAPASGSTDLTDVTIDGNTAVGGGGVYNTGPMTITGGAITDNSASSAGGIFNNTGSIVASDLALDGNTATGATAGTGIGGGLYNTGTVALTDGSVSDGSAVVGGGIANLAGTVSLDGTSVAGNDAVSAGGIYNVATLNTEDAAIIGNTATAVEAPGTGLGGGLSNGGTASLQGGELSGNTATGSGTIITGLGGGAFNGGATARLELDGVTVDGNTATGSTSVQQTGWGGGIYTGANGASDDAELVVERSTLSGNSAIIGAAIMSFAPGATGTSHARISLSTLSGNTPTLGGGGSYWGSTHAALSVIESTIASNASGLVQNGDATANVSGSIVFGNGGAGCANSNTATVTDGGHNLAGTGDTSCFPAGNGNVFGNPQLGSLGANGGPTETMLPSTTSPALDQIPSPTATGVSDAVDASAISICTGADDQRGDPRPSGARCDIGSVEVAQTAPVISGPASGTFVVGSPGDLAEYMATGNPVPTFSSLDLPNGLGVASTGSGKAKITGTPQAGTAGVHTVHITATNEAGSDTMDVQLTINQAPSISGPTTIHMVEGLSGGAAYTSAGFPLPAMTPSGTFPTGVAFTPSGDGSGGTIGGTPGPGTAGPTGTIYMVNLTAANGIPPDAVKTVFIEVVPLLFISTTSLPPGAVGVPYNQPVEAIGGTQPYTFSLLSGSLPPGLTLASNGTISGTPTGPNGTSSFTVQAVDSTSPTQQSDTQALSITIDRGPTTLTVGKVIITTGPLGVNIGSVNATLKGGVPGVGIPGQTIVYKVGATTVCTGVTNASGFNSCSMAVDKTILVILNGGVTATYAGNAFWLPASGSNTLL